MCVLLLLLLFIQTYQTSLVHAKVELSSFVFYPWYGHLDEKSMASDLYKFENIRVQNC